MKTKIVVICYLVASAALFLGAVFIIPGFPFFPQVVLKTTEESTQTKLDKGEYTLLYFIEGKQNLAVSRGDIGKIDLFGIGSDKENIPIPSVAEGYYFDDAPNQFGVRGHAVCSFYIPINQTIIIKSQFKEFGYDGLIVRTSLGKFILSIISYEATVIMISCLFTLAIVRRLQSEKLN